MVEGISNATTYQAAYQSTANSSAASTTAASTAAANDEQKEAVDTVEISSQSSAKTSSKADRSAIIAQLKADQQARIDSFRSLVEKVITKQSNASSIASFDFNNFNQNNTLKDHIQGLISGGNIDSETIKTAQANIAEDGEYGVQKTAERILNFAKALIGDDMESFEKIKDAVLKGFGEAEKAWGGELPSISKQTKDLIMSVFDKWEQDGNTSFTSYSELAQNAAKGVAK